MTAKRGGRRCDEKGNIIALGLPVDFDSDGFASGLVRGFQFLSRHDAPYLVHCTEGKDRAGFASMILEALMGASYDEIVADYMISYENYYGVEPGTEKYEKIIDKNIRAMLCSVAGTDTPEEADLSAAVEAFLLTNGMKQEEIDMLRRKLSGISENITG